MIREQKWLLKSSSLTTNTTEIHILDGVSSSLAAVHFLVPLDWCPVKEEQLQIYILLIRIKFIIN